MKINWLEKARQSWSHTGSKRPPFAIAPKKRSAICLGFSATSEYRKSEQTSTN